jgi:hypothetical protein
MAFRWDASIARWSSGTAIYFMPHIKAFVGRGRGQSGGQLQVEADAISDRKATAKSLWRGAGA